MYDILTEGGGGGSQKYPKYVDKQCINFAAEEGMSKNPKNVLT